MSDLLFVTTQLGESYAAWKEEEKNKEEDRKSFFILAVEALKANMNLELRTKVVEVAAEDLDRSFYWAERKHPRFVAEGAQFSHEKEGVQYFKVVLKENPEFVNFSFHNPNDGQTYTRRVDDGKLYIDESLLEEENSELYESVTMETWGGRRVMCPLDLMKPAMQQSVADYIFPSPPKVVLAPPRPTKPEELA